MTTISLEAPVVSHSYSPQEDRLVLACNNGVVALHSHANTFLTRAALSPRLVSWLQPGALVAVANDRGHVQCFDMALGLVRLQLDGEETGQGSAVRLLDLADYFCHQPSLWGLSWAPAPVVLSLSKDVDAKGEFCNLKEQHSSLLLLLHYAKGPLACLRFNAPHFSLTHPIIDTSTTGGQVSEISSSDTQSIVSAKIQSPSFCHYSSILPDVLVTEYLRHNQLEEATNLCSSLCWQQDGGVALKCISAVINNLLRKCGPQVNLWEERVLAAAQVLSSGFLANSGPLSQETERRFGPPVRSLARRLFFKVHRMKCLEAAYKIACDLGDPDCFLLLSKTAHNEGLTRLSVESQAKADELFSGSSCCSDASSYTSSSGSQSGSYSDESSCSECSSSSSCSSSCSTCSSESDGEERGEREGGDGSECDDGTPSKTSGQPGANDERVRLGWPGFTQEEAEGSQIPAPILPPTYSNVGCSETFQSRYSAVPSSSSQCYGVLKLDGQRKDNKEPTSAITSSEDGKVTINITQNSNEPQSLRHLAPSAHPPQNCDGGFRRSQRNLADAMDAADSAVAAIQQRKPLALINEEMANSIPQGKKLNTHLLSKISFIVT